MTEENQQISREQDEQVPMPEQRHETDDHARPIERAQEEKPGIGSDDPTAVPEPTAKELSPTQSPAGGEPTAAVPLVPGGPRDEVPKGAPPPWVPGGWGPWGPARTPSGFHSATGGAPSAPGQGGLRPPAGGGFVPGPSGGGGGPSWPGGGGGFGDPPGPQGPPGFSFGAAGWGSPQDHHRHLRRYRITSLVLAAALVALIGIGHVAWPSGSGTVPQSSQAPNVIVPGGSGGSSTPSGGPSNVNGIAAKVDPGLVDIDTSLYGGGEAAGTGMVLTPSGEVLTNNHVVEGATSIHATDIGNGKTYNVTVVGYDISRDVAVLQLQGASGLQTVSLGNSSNVKVGDQVVGIGNAGGVGGTPSAVGGTVTALNQSITATDQGSGASEQLSGLIETDADIQAGDSGGPLVNTSGQVIGMDTAASQTFQFETQGAQAYSIPINEAVTISKQIEAGNGSTTVHIGPTAFIGVQVTPASSAGSGFPFGNIFGSPGGSAPVSSGAAIVQVEPGTPAAQAGLTAGDVIVSFGGQSVTSPSQLTNLLIQYHPNQQVQIGWVDSSGQHHSATIQLATGPVA